MSNRFIVPLAAALLCSTPTVLAHPFQEPEGVDEESNVAVPVPVIVESTGLVPVTLYTTGETILVESGRTIRPFCNSDMRSITVDDLRRQYEETRAKFEDPAQYSVFDTTPIGRGGGFNIIFNLSNDVPDEALPAIQAAEQYIEQQFGDPVTIRMTLDYANLGGGTLGAASSNDAAFSYATVRESLIDGMDGNDSIQMILPTGTTIPVRYVSTSTNVTNETRVFFNNATIKATIGNVGGTDTFITFNNTVNWDYDPSNGVPFNATDFQSVLIHEVGHGLGFTSGADFRTNDIEQLDLYRFPVSDLVNGVNMDYDPDTNEEFQTSPRMVDLDTASSEDNGEVAANSDLIFVEYRMSDGRPSQASHFNEGFNGIMDPTIGGGQTFFPDFYRVADLTMLDAIGWDIPPAAPTGFGFLTPEDGATGVSTTATLEWEESVGASTYSLIVDDDPGFGSPEIDVQTATNAYTVQEGELDALTTYFWTISASNELGAVPVTGGPRSFTTTILPPGDFTLVTPADFSTVPVNVTFEWTASSDADEYRVEVSTNVFFSDIIIDEVIEGATSFSPAAGTLQPTTLYFWRVTAINIAESKLSNPSTARFTTDESQVNDCSADFDGDGDVDLTDFGTFGAAFNSSIGDANYDPSADFDDDGDVDLTDFGAFGAQFNRTNCLG